MDSVTLMKSFLEPESIALIGVSRQSGDGTNVLKNLLSYGYSGKIYPVNPNAEEIFGVKAYPNVRDIPDKVDLALLLTPRMTVPEIIRECARKGIKSVIVVAQGFAEADEGGKTLQQEITKIAAGSGLRIIGPNTFGVANAFKNLSTSFGALWKMKKIPVGTIAQSGFLFANIPQSMIVGKAVDLGNACDVSFADVLEYFEADPDIQLIAIYIESVKDINRFITVARRVAKKKPILALKGGRGESGLKLALSHTGSVMGRDEIWETVFKRCGIIRVEDIDELDDGIKTFLSLPLIRGKGLAVITYPFACGVLAVDACQKYHLELAKLSGETLEKLARLFPPWLSLGNPVDLTPPGFISGKDTKEAFRIILGLVLNDPNTDAVLFCVPSSRYGQIYAYSEIVNQYADEFSNKAIVGWFYGFDPYRESAIKYESKDKVAIYPTLERAIRAISRLVERYKFLNQVE
jgi:acetyltransferase